MLFSDVMEQSFLTSPSPYNEGARGIPILKYIRNPETMLNLATMLRLVYQRNWITESFLSIACVLIAFTFSSAHPRAVLKA